MVRILLYSHCPSDSVIAHLGSQAVALQFSLIENDPDAVDFIDDLIDHPNVKDFVSCMPRMFTMHRKLPLSFA